MRMFFIPNIWIAPIRHVLDIHNKLSVQDDRKHYYSGTHVQRICFTTQGELPRMRAFIKQ